MIYILGASGFLGSKIVNFFNEVGNDYIPVYRSMDAGLADTAISLEEFLFRLEDKRIGESAVIVNVIGTAHVSKNDEKRNPGIFEEANYKVCVRIALSAKKARVKKFIQISSIGVLGKNLIANVLNCTEPAPTDLYAKSKLEAERTLKKIFDRGDTALTIIRPTLVYGKNPKGNFKTLISLIKSSLPLPLGSLSNIKSFISDRNLASFIHLSCQSSITDGNTWNLADPDSDKIITFIQRISDAMCQNVIIFNFPLHLMSLCFHVFGKKYLFEKLNEDFYVNMDETIKVTGWQPVETQEAALIRILGDNCSG